MRLNRAPQPFVNLAMVAREALTHDWFASLRERAVRDREKLFLAEGFRFLHKARESNADIVGVAICPKLYPGGPVGSAFRGLGVPILKLDIDQFCSVAQSKEPQGVLIAVRQRWHRLIDVPGQGQEANLLLDAARSNGNVGTILRSCEAFGANSVWFVGGEADPYDPVCVRATMGAIFTQRLVRTSAKAILGWKSRRSCRFIGLDSSGQRDFRSGEYYGPVTLVMGSERNGLRPSQRALCDQVVKIPMVGPTDSLNLAVATSLALFEVFRSR